MSLGSQNCCTNRYLLIGGGICDIQEACCGNGCMVAGGTCFTDNTFCADGETFEEKNGKIICCNAGSCTPAAFILPFAEGAVVRTYATSIDPLQGLKARGSGIDIIGGLEKRCEAFEDCCCCG